MIGKILKGRPHVARSACVKGEDDVGTVLRLLATLFAERVLVDLGPVYGDATRARGQQASDDDHEGAATPPVVVLTGGERPQPRLPPRPAPTRPRQHIGAPDARAPVPVRVSHTGASNVPGPVGDSLVGSMAEASGARAQAHEAFLRFSRTAVAGMGDVLAFQAQLVDTLGVPDAPATRVPVVSRPAYDRDMCMEFAVGSAAKVLGSEFAALDRYPVRVRLPDEPLMLVDRILAVEGVKGAMTAGRVVTELDVRSGAWYLDGHRAPVCITVEGGQADLFLCSYLGIDLALQGTRAYRLLDATVTFHRGLPQSGEVVRYDIHIDRFVRQGETYLFFFRFEGTVGGRLVVSMEDGCAGFFTEQETAESGGIVLAPEERDQQSVVKVQRRTTGRQTSGRQEHIWQALVPMAVDSYDARQLAALRDGDLAGCFGPLFNGLDLNDPVRIPGGRMHLFDRVVELDLTGGRCGLGLTRAEADIRGDEWFLTCHFVDDMVMPGTLMYECCVHTLRVLLMRMGWVTERTGVCYEPVPGVSSTLRCRGPVTSATRLVTYEVQIKEIGYKPEPYAVADGLVYADGQRIVQFTDMSLKMTGATREQIEATWRRARTIPPSPTPIGAALVPAEARPALYGTDHILAFAVGRPSEAFGEPYCVFDADRRIARLPGPPYTFLDRITDIHAEAWHLEPGGWIEAQYDVPRDGWYFRANRQQSMPFAIVLEIALQPCGWLAAYLGSALHSRDDLSFRNLGGRATLYEELFGDAGTLTMRVRMTKVSEAAGMIVQSFDIQIWRAGRIVYDGDTQFGFFSVAALAQQVGIRDAADRLYVPEADEARRGRRVALETLAPLTPDDGARAHLDGALLPARALRMIDEIALYVPDGGPNGLGFIRGVKEVDSHEWFFAAHFYQDPVCPGSLGLESFLQLLKVVALDRWGERLRHTHRFEPMLIGREHTWVYRGQIVPSNRRVEVEVVVTEIQDGPTPTVVGNGFLKVDGIPIYEMKDFGVRLVDDMG
jgi:3-hydroxymyristoyl/3-hydroxydecanoyl-(acyl carrier protein) dehydratase